jgi:N-acetylglucosaminyldiphosphoundecaprenol N-acetyl-beta-D-mannosaminyltransferase
VEPHRSTAAFYFRQGRRVISKCSRFAEFRRFFSYAWLVIADGQPLVTASRLFGEYWVPERVATTDLFHDDARIAVHRDLSFVIYGATADENSKALCSIRKIYPQVRITRSSHGYLTEDEQAKVCSGGCCGENGYPLGMPWRSA